LATVLAPHASRMVLCARIKAALRDRIPGWDVDCHEDYLGAHSVVAMPLDEAAGDVAVVIRPERTGCVVEMMQDDRLHGMGRYPAMAVALPVVRQAIRELDG